MLYVCVFYFLAKLLKDDPYGKKFMVLLIISLLLRIYFSFLHEVAVYEFNLEK